LSVGLELGDENMAIQLAGLQKWPITPFDRQFNSEEFDELRTLYREKAKSLPTELITHIRWLMFISRLTEGEMVVTAEGAHNRSLRIGLNEEGRVLLTAFRAENGIGDAVAKAIHGIPLKDDEKFNGTRYAEYESRIRVSNYN
jgi:hypothetical protein